MSKTAMAGDGMESALFDVVIRPYRSLSPQGFRILMAAVAGVVLVLCLVFLSQGLWPVLPFFGCELLLIAWAFRSNFRDRKAYEAVKLTNHALHVEQGAASGTTKRFLFQPPHWLQVDLQRHPNGSNKLVIRSHGRVMTIAQFLSPDEKISFANALRAALRRLRPDFSR